MSTVIESLLRDARYAARALRRSPVFLLTAILTLGLAIGANSAIFTVVRAVLLQPLPYADADRLVMLGERWPNLAGARPVSMLNYIDWTRQSTVFEKIAAVSRNRSSSRARSSPSYFEVFGLRAALGRTFAPEEDQPGRRQVVVLSHRLWVSQFASDPAVIDTAIRLARTVSGENISHVKGIWSCPTRIHTAQRRCRPSGRTWAPILSCSART